MNASNFIHAAYAVAFQCAIGVAFGDWLTGAAVAVGFLVGVEWMQQIRVHVSATGRRWPAKLDAYDVLSGFAWDNKDRYFDVGIGAAVCALVWHFSR